MPSNAIKNFPEMSGKSKEEVERLYQKAKEIVKDEYPEVKVGSDQFYQLTIGIVKRMSRIKDEDMSTGSVGVSPGGSGAHSVRMFNLSPEEVEQENKKRQKVLDYIKNYK